MAVTIVAGMLMMVGLIGVVVPFASGLVLVVLGTVLWAFVRGDGRAWIVVGATVALYALGPVARRPLRPARAAASAGRGGHHNAAARGGDRRVVGFFVIPVVGAPLDIFLLARARDRDAARARDATKAALRGVVASRASSWRPASRSCLRGWSAC